VPALTGGLALSGTAGLRDASVAGLDLADAFGGDKRANRLDNLSVEAKIAGLGEPIDVNGGLDWRDDRFDIKARATPSALAAGAPSPVMVRVGSKRVTVGFDGNASTSGKADGKVLVETPSVRGLAEWLGNPLPPGKGLEKFRFSGKLAFAKDVLSFTNADVVLDGTEGSGSGRIALGGKRPNIKAKLALSVLTLDPYLGGGAASGGGGGKAAKGWSKEPIDFSGLRAADADLELSTKGIRWDQIKIGKTEIAVKLAGGKLDARLTKMGLYRGTGTGHLVLDCSTVPARAPPSTPRSSSTTPRPSRCCATPPISSISRAPPISTSPSRPTAAASTTWSRRSTAMPASTSRTAPFAASTSPR